MWGPVTIIDLKANKIKTKKPVCGIHDPGTLEATPSLVLTPLVVGIFMHMEWATSFEDNHPI